ncbi:MAG: hypothetical protein AB1476_04655 [Candidatus Hadarchaeota archaeon]
MLPRKFKLPSRVMKDGVKREVGLFAGVAFLFTALACGISGSLKLFLFLPPLFLLGVLLLALFSNRRLFGVALIVLLFIPTAIGGSSIALLFLPPFLFLTIPYLIIAAVFLLGKSPGGPVEGALVLTCVLLLLPGVPGPGNYIWVAGGFQPALLSAFSNSAIGVEVVAPDNSPLAGLEVDLWLESAGYASTNWRPLPDAGKGFTDTGGRVTFKVIAGEYRIGFNMLNFPQDNYLPTESTVHATAKGSTSITIQLQQKT